MTDQLTPADSTSVAARHDLAHQPMRDPGDTGGLHRVFSHRYLLKLSVKREIKARYVGSKFGLAWSYINPLVRFLTFYFVFVVIIQRGAIPHFAIHLFAGMVLMHFFTESFNAGTRSIMANKSLVQKMPLPREMFPVASMLVSMYHTGPQIIILIGACLVTGSFHPDLPAVGAAFLAFGIIMLLGTAMGVMFSAINVLFRDLTRIVQTLTQMLPFTVPMMYPYTLVYDRFHHIPWLYHAYLFNPLTDAVLLFQRAFWWTTVDARADGSIDAKKDVFSFDIVDNFPSHLWERGFAMLAFAVVFLFFAQWVFRRLDDRIPEEL
jgi:ABC-2 type transport system permease protein